MKNEFWIDTIKLSTGAILGLFLVTIFLDNDGFTVSNILSNIAIGLVLGLCLAKYNQHQAEKKRIKNNN